MIFRPVGWVTSGRFGFLDGILQVDQKQKACEPKGPFLDFEMPPGRRRGLNCNAECVVV